MVPAVKAFVESLAESLPRTMVEANREFHATMNRTSDAAGMAATSKLQPSRARGAAGLNKTPSAGKARS
jgi:microcystin degradation protein MlrC